MKEHGIFLCHEKKKKKNLNENGNVIFHVETAMITSLHRYKHIFEVGHLTINWYIVRAQINITTAVRYAGLANQ